MTVQTILVLMALGALVVGFGATGFGLSPWLLFGLGWVPSAVVLVLAEQAISRPCYSSGSSDVAGLFETASILGVTFFGAAAVAGLADGVRLAVAREYYSAFSRAHGRRPCAAGGPRRALRRRLRRRLQEARLRRASVCARRPTRYDRGCARS